MKTITLRIPDDNQYKMLLEFLNEMGIKPENALGNLNPVPDKKRMQTALEGLAAAGGIAAIKNAAIWEREQRQDRPLR
jgi:hypothetical protein